jgi:hypothetical protein
MTCFLFDGSIGKADENPRSRLFGGRSEASRMQDVWNDALNRSGSA